MSNVERTHCLKTWPSYFRALWVGTKTFEVRRNDRDFKAGDNLMLREWTPQTGLYSGRALMVRVTYVATELAGIAPGFCVMGFKRTQAYEFWQDINGTPESPTTPQSQPSDDRGGER